LPFVRTEHSTRAYVDPSCWPFSRWSLRRARAVVAISRHIESVVVESAPWVTPRLEVIRNGVDTERFAPRQVPAPTPAIRLAFVGRLEPRKGLDLALDALARVPDALLDVVGDGEQRAPLEARARSLGARVVFHGRRDDIRPILASCDALVCSSREEGLGIAVLEAMAMGKPVVAFPVGGVPEIVEHGETGLLAQARAPDALATRIREAAADRAHLAKMGRAARQRAVERFSIDAMCRAYGAVYAKVKGS
jgi:glycosyltransferase involved in cell wall biosynthesis